LTDSGIVDQAQQVDDRAVLEATPLKRLAKAETVQQRLTELSRSVRTEWLTLIPENALLLGPRDIGSSLEASVLERGAALRVIYQEGLRGDPKALRQARELSERGGQTRIAAALPVPMVIVDQQVALIPLDPRHPLCGALEVRNPSAVSLLRLMFDQLWTGAALWNGSSRLGGEERVGRDRALLILLSDGHTDESISRRLGISLRTERRLVADLMARLGARSRFEAGAQAVRYGLI
jgi:DNA-binding CsgD family transcriptional regulator